MKTSILIVDSHKMIREALRLILERQPEFTVVAEAPDAQRAAEAARQTQAHVALVEMHLKGAGGVHAIRRIAKVSPRTRCIVLSGQESPVYVKQALLAGASGFVPKNSSAKELVEAVRAVRGGRSYLAQSVSDSVVGTIRSGAGGPAEFGITARQLEVLRLIAEGLSTPEIANELGIAVKTAQTHRANLMGKIGVSKASGLVRFAIREGIIAA